MKQTTPSVPGAGETAGLPPSQQTRCWVLVSAFWVLITLATALHDWLAWGGEFWQALRFGTLMWLPWVVVTPAIVWFSTVFPLERSCWRWRLATHLGLLAIITVLFGFVAHWAALFNAARKRSRRSAPVSSAGRSPIGAAGQ